MTITAPDREHVGRRGLLLGGVLAGPLYVASGLGQALARDGFDLTRHSISLLSNGSLGWIQIATFVLAGILVVGLALGLRDARVPAPRAPALIAVYGVALIASGLLVADPSHGFPPGTPPGPPATMSWHGTLHLLVGGVGFLSLIIACGRLALGFQREGRRGWAAFSAAAGAALLLGFAAVAVLPGEPLGTLGLGLGVLLSWAWTSALALDAMRGTD